MESAGMSIAAGPLEQLPLHPGWLENIRDMMQWPFFPMFQRLNFSFWGGYRLANPIEHGYLQRTPNNYIYPHVM